MADLKTTQERRDRFRAWLHDDTRDHLSIRAWCVAEDACDDVDTLRAELARLIAPVEGSGGEPTDYHLFCVGRKAYNNAAGLAQRPSDAAGIAAVQAIRASLVAHERARLAAAGVTVATAEDAALFVATAEDAAPSMAQPAQDRATDGDLLAMAADAYRLRSREDATLDDMRKLALRVAARVRGERCLVAQAVGMPGVLSVTLWRETPAHASSPRFGVSVNTRRAVTQAPADVPATLARLLGGVGK